MTSASGVHVTESHKRSVSRSIVAAVAASAIGLLLSGMVAGPAQAVPTIALVNLGAASSYSVLASSAVTNDGKSHFSGNVGVAPRDEMTGIATATVDGTVHIDDPHSIAANAALVTAYNDAAGRTPTAAISGDIGGLNITPGVYHSVGALTMTTDLTFDGQNKPNSVFIIQVGGAVNTTATRKMTLINGAKASNVFWQVVGAVTMGAGCTFVGTILGNAAITLGVGTAVQGRALTKGTAGAVTLSTNDFSGVAAAATAPSLVITSPAITNDSTPTITGTSNAPASTVVTVKVGAQTITSPVSSTGTWSVTTAPLRDGTSKVVATVTNAVGTTTKTQLLVVDTTAPTLDITSDPTSTTATPTITGMSDAPPGTTVTVTVGSQVLTSLVDSDGNWSVDADTLPDGKTTVTASVTDRAGNTTRVTQQLTIDTSGNTGGTGGTAPTLDITSPALTKNNPPTITGTSDAPADTVVTVTVGTQELTSPIDSDGNWSVSPDTLPEGPNTVTASVTDNAGNTTTASQQLTIDTIAPTLVITSPALTKNNPPTITGTSDAPTGTIVTVKVGTQVLTAPVSANGTWSVTTAKLPEGTNKVTASIADAAGNVTIKTQQLKVSTVAPTLNITSPAITKNNPPTITGTSNAPARTIVTVTVGTQKFTTLLSSAGTWSVTAATLREGMTKVTASITDAGGNIISRTQQLVIDTTAPTLVITSPALTKNNPPTITGTSDAPAGTIVTVKVGTQVLTAPVSANGTWSATPTRLADGDTLVTVSVSDPAGNTTTTTQVLSVNTSTPAPVSAGWSVNYANAVIQGTTDAAVGTKVVVTIASQVLTTSVQPGGLWAIRLNPMQDATYLVQVVVTEASGKSGSGFRLLKINTAGAPAVALVQTSVCPAYSPNNELSVAVSNHTLSATIQQYGVWSVSPAKANDCNYVVVASVADEAGDTGMYSRVLTANSTAPVVTIYGGASAIANPDAPIFMGTSTAPAGSSVRVRMSQQTVMTTVLSDGTWSVYRNQFAAGIHQLVVRITTPDGRVGYALQALTVVSNR